MKKIQFILIAGLIFVSMNVYAANGDLIVNGKIGVGTTSPVNKLDVQGGIISTTQTVGATNGAFMQGDSLKAYFGNLGTNDIYFGNANNWGYMVIKNGGSVGIGTTTPNAKLQVKGGAITLDNYQQIGLAKTDGTANYWQIFSDNGTYGPVDALTIWGAGATRMVITPPGNVGIGTASPQYKLDVNGIIRGANVSASDKRYKENIKNLEKSLDKLVRLQGTSFNWKTKDYADNNFPDGTHFGVIAQEIEKVFPEVVSTDADGMKSVAYTEIIPVLIEAIKEQQKKIDTLTQRISDLEAKKSK